MTTYHEIRTYIADRLGSDVLEQILTFLHQDRPSLWGIDKYPAFFNESACLAIYKDMTGDGYQKIMKEISFLGGLNDKSFRTNTQRFRKKLEKWGRTQINLETSQQWEAEKKLMEKNPDLEKVNLWIDSTDFPKIKYKGVSKKGPDWSFKCNRPGLRFTTIESASRRIRKIWGGYSPKIHDGEFIALKKQYFEKRLINGVIIGDEHYSKGNKIFQRLKFLTPVRKPRNQESEIQTAIDSKAERL